MCGTPKGYGNWSYEMFLKGKQTLSGIVFNILHYMVVWLSEKEIEQAKTRLRSKNI